VGLDLSREEREFHQHPKGLVLSVPFLKPRGQYGLAARGMRKD